MCVFSWILLLSISCLMDGINGGEVSREWRKSRECVSAFEVPRVVPYVYEFPS